MHFTIVTQVKEAFKIENLLATLIGFIFGCVVPGAVYVSAHMDMLDAKELWLQYPSYIVAGGLAVSAITVYKWAYRAYQEPGLHAVLVGVKAVGLVVVLDGVMTTSTTLYARLVALVLLCVINGIATGTNLSVQDKDFARLAKIERKTKKNQTTNLFSNA